MQMAKSGRILKTTAHQEACISVRAEYNVVVAEQMLVWCCYISHAFCFDRSFRYRYAQSTYISKDGL